MLWRQSSGHGTSNSNIAVCTIRWLYKTPMIWIKRNTFDFVLSMVCRSCVTDRYDNPQFIYAFLSPSRDCLQALRLSMLDHIQTYMSMMSFLWLVKWFDHKLIFEYFMFELSLSKQISSGRLSYFSWSTAASPAFEKNLSLGSSTSQAIGKHPKWIWVWGLDPKTWSSAKHDCNNTLLGSVSSPFL